MFQRLYEFAKQLLVLTTDTQQNKLEIRELQQQVQSLSTSLQDLAFEVRRLRDEHQHEQEKMVLRLENASLRLEQKLLAAGDRSDREVGLDAAGDP